SRSRKKSTQPNRQRPSKVPPMAHDVLIVDDEADIRLLISGILEDEGYRTRDAADGPGALEQIQSRRPSLVVLDVWLQGSALDGLEVLEAIKREHPSVP